MYHIYQLEIGLFWYIGSSKTKSRLAEHKYQALTPNWKNGNKYNKKLSVKLRELGITKSNFYERVIETILDYEPIPDKKMAEEIENLYIDLDNPYCLNSKRSGMNYEDNKVSYQQNLYNKQKEIIYCSLCDYKGKKKLNQRAHNCHFNSVKHLLNELWEEF